MTTEKKANYPAALICSLILLVVGVVHMTSWLIGKQAYLAFSPAYPTMQFNAALAFTVLAAGIYFLHREQKKMALIMATIVAGYGFAVIIEYVFSVNLGIDQFFLKVALTPQTSHPGRPAPNTVICFALAGIILAGLSLKKKLYETIFGFYCSYCLIAFAISCLIGYSVGLDSAFGWGHFTRMAIFTAINFIVAGVAFLSTTWKSNILFRSAGIVFTVGIILSLMILQLLLAENGNLLRTRFELDSRERVLAVKQAFDLTGMALEGFKGFFGASEYVNPQEFSRFASKAIIPKMGLQAIDWVPRVTLANRKNFELEAKKNVSPTFFIKDRQPGQNPNLEPQFVESPQKDFYFSILYTAPMDKNQSALGFDHASDPDRLDTMKKAAQTGTAVATPPIKLFRETNHEQTGLVIFSPFSESEKPVTINEVKGYFAAIILTNQFLEMAFSHLVPLNIGISISDVTNAGAPIPIISSSINSISFSDRLEYSDTISAYGRTYQINVYPGPEYLKPFKGTFPWVSFVVVFALAFIISGAMRREAEVNMALEKANEDQEKFIHIVSHELRNPLGLLKQPVANVAEGLMGEVNEKQKKMLDITLRAIDRLLATSTELLDLSKLEEGKDSLKLSSFDICLFVTEMSESFEVIAQKQGVELRLNLPDRCRIVADKIKIGRVITNFISNAFIHTVKGFIEISVTDYDKTIEVAVTDSGPGIPATYLPRMFSKFEQFSDGPSRRSLGTGLGLALSKEIIEEHQGKIGVTSTEGTGSRFYFVIPKSQS